MFNPNNVKQYVHSSVSAPLLARYCCLDNIEPKPVVEQYVLDFEDLLVQSQDGRRCFSSHAGRYSLGFARCRTLGLGHFSVLGFAEFITCDLVDEKRESLSNVIKVSGSCQIVVPKWAIASRTCE